MELRAQLLIAAVSAGLLGCTFASRSEGPVEYGQRAVPSKSLRWTSPLLDCESADDRRELRPFHDELHRLADSLAASKRVTHISIYYRDLHNGPWIGINEKEEFLPASLLKVPFMVAIHKAAQDSPSILDEVLTVPPVGGIPDDQHFAPRSTLVSGSTHTVRSLLASMVARSDNVATFLLTSRFGLRGMHDFYDDLGIVTDDGVPDRLRVKDYAAIFRLLYNASYLDRAHSEQVIEALTRSEFRVGIVAPIPRAIPVAHKYGERLLLEKQTKQLHDCGIVYHPGRPYLLCVMTRGSDWDALTGAIVRVSETVYREVSRQPRSR